MVGEPKQTIALDPAQCWHALARTSVGRVALSAQALPVVVPVGFAVIGDALLLRTVHESVLRAPWDGAVVAFEAGEWDALGRIGWSVLVQGTTWPIDHPDDLPAIADSLPSPWAPGEDRFVLLSCHTIQGRRSSDPPDRPGPLDPTTFG